MSFSEDLFRFPFQQAQEQRRTYTVSHGRTSCIWLESHKKNLLRIDEIDSKLEKNVEKQQTLRTLMARGYIEPPLFTEEINELAQEAEALTA